MNETNRTIELMIQKARESLPYSYAPYSNYTVASTILSENNAFYTGVNVENCAYGLTICAESAAICQMIAHGCRQIKRIVVLAGDNALCAPCGACRQRIEEFSTPETVIDLCDHERVLKSIRIAELLPLAFSLKNPNGPPYV